MLTLNRQRVSCSSVLFRALKCDCAAVHLAVGRRDTVSGEQPWTAAFHCGSPHDEWTGLPQRYVCKPCTRVDAWNFRTVAAEVKNQSSKQTIDVSEERMCSFVKNCLSVEDTLIITR